MLEKLDEFFRTRGCQASVIEVLASNVEAGDFYSRLGYEERDIWLYKRL